MFIFIQEDIVVFKLQIMDFTLEELRVILEEMGLKNVPESHLEPFAKGFYHI